MASREARVLQNEAVNRKDSEEAIDKRKAVKRKAKAKEKRNIKKQKLDQFVVKLNAFLIDLLNKLIIIIIIIYYLQKHYKGNGNGIKWINKHYKAKHYQKRQHKCR